jgi:hypothetical protein
MDVLRSFILIVHHNALNLHFAICFIKKLGKSIFIKYIKIETFRKIKYMSLYDSVSWVKMIGNWHLLIGRHYEYSIMKINIILKHTHDFDIYMPISAVVDQSNNRNFLIHNSKRFIMSSLIGEDVVLNER